MQPYFFPYIGYFQLIKATDIFVLYDDVNFINRGWINRNRILVNGADVMITVPCKDASQNKLIKDVELVQDAKTMQKLLATIKMAYSKARYFTDVYPMLERTLMGEATISLADLACASIVNTCNYLGIKREFKKSSEQYNNRDLKKADRLIDICKIEGAKKYINMPGGKEIYTKEYYAENGVELDFLVPRNVEYPQFKNAFVPWLSIIDVLMFNSREDINDKILTAYTLD